MSLKVLNKKLGFTYLLIAVCLLHIAYPVIYSTSLIELKELQQLFIKEHAKSERYHSLSYSKTVFDAQYDRFNNEVIFEGRIYDVVSYQIEHDQVKCLVLDDEEENEINERLDISLDRGSAKCHNEKQMGYWWPLFVQQLTTEDKKENIAAPISYLPFAPDMVLPRGYYLLINPPPEYCLV